MSGRYKTRMREIDRIYGNEPKPSDKATRASRSKGRSAAAEDGG